MIRAPKAETACADQSFMKSAFPQSVFEGGILDIRRDAGAKDGVCFRRETKNLGFYEFALRRRPDTRTLLR